MKITGGLGDGRPRDKFRPHCRLLKNKYGFLGFLPGPRGLGRPPEGPLRYPWASGGIPKAPGT